MNRADIESRKQGLHGEIAGLQNDIADLRDELELLDAMVPEEDAAPPDPAPIEYPHFDGCRCAHCPGVWKR